jgi:hypothetical protein
MNTQMIQEEISLLVSSDPTQGAVNRSSDGSQFEVQLDDPLEIPKDAVNCTVECEESTIWWTIANIKTGINDTLYIFGDDDTTPVPVPQLYTVVIDQGLYDLTALNNTVQSKLEALGARTLDALNNPLPLVSFSPDDATQKVLLRFNYTNVTVDFTQTNTPREILGYDSLVYGAYPGAPLNILAPNIAQFNQVNYFLIACDLVQKGIRFNNRYNQVVTQVLINVAPGSQITASPRHPAKTNANELIGSKRTNLRFRLTDDKLRPVDTAGEYYTTRIVIKYWRPFRTT